MENTEVKSRKHELKNDEHVAIIAQWSEGKFFAEIILGRFSRPQSTAYHDSATRRMRVPSDSVTQSGDGTTHALRIAALKVLSQ